MKPSGSIDTWVSSTTRLVSLNHFSVGTRIRKSCHEHASTQFLLTKAYLWLWIWGASLLTVNPGHWTEDMRTDALTVAELSDPNLKVWTGTSPISTNGRLTCSLQTLDYYNPALHSAPLDMLLRLASWSQVMNQIALAWIPPSFSIKLWIMHRLFSMR